MGESKRRLAAGHVPTPRLSDRERIEVALPAILAGALVFAEVFGPDPDATDAKTAQAEVAAKTKRIRTLTMAGVTEPFAECRQGERNRLLRRAADLGGDCIRAMGFEDQSSVKFAMTYYYWLEDLLSREVLSLTEGSNMAEAVSMLLPMMEHGFDNERRDASARKQAARMLRWFQERGFYLDAGMSAEAAE
jgi:hypothetical protein